MIKIYIDFDEVILETWDILLREYCLKYKTKEIEQKKIKEVMFNIGWKNILKRSNEINNSIQNIKKLQRKHKVYIITKFNSLEEREEKRQYLNKKGINNLVFVPYTKSKAEIVNPYKSLLVDDNIQNLIEWSKRGGTAILFNKDLCNTDSYGNKNIGFLVIDNLLDICDIIE